MPTYAIFANSRRFFWRRCSSHWRWLISFLLQLFFQFLDLHIQILNYITLVFHCLLPWLGGFPDAPFHLLFVYAFHFWSFPDCHRCGLYFCFLDYDLWLRFGLILESINRLLETQHFLCQLILLALSDLHFLFQLYEL